MVINIAPRRRVLGKQGRPIDEAVELYRTRGMGHVFRIQSHRLPPCPMVADIGLRWRSDIGGYTKTPHQCMQSTTVALSQVRRFRLTGRRPRDTSKQWLKTVQPMAQNPSQWRRPIHSSLSSPISMNLVIIHRVVILPRVNPSLL